MTDVTAQEFLDRVAEVFAANWSKNSRGLSLGRSPEQIRVIQQQALHARIDRFRRVRDEYQSLINLTPPLNVELASQVIKRSSIEDDHDHDHDTYQIEVDSSLASQAQLPSTRLAIAILGCIDPRRIGVLESGTRSVFASEPTPTQLPLESTSDAIDEFLRGRAKLSHAIEHLAGHNFPNGRDALQLGGPNEVGPFRVLATIRCDQGRASALQMILIDSEKHQVAHANLDISQPYSYTLSQKQKLGLLRSEAAKSGLDVSLETRELAEAIQGQRPLSQSEVARLMLAMKSEPLSLSTSEVLIGDAKRRGVNVIALLPDRAELVSLRACAAGKTSTEVLAAMLELQGIASKRTLGSWEIVSCENPVLVAENRIPRLALAGIFNSILDQKFLSLDALSSLYLSCPVDADFMLAKRAILWSLPGGASDLLTVDADILRLLKDIPSRDRVLMAERFGLLTAGEQVLIHRIAFGGNVPLADPVAEGQTPTTRILEVTEELPQGLERDDFVEAEVKLEEKYAISGRNGLGTDLAGSRSEVGLAEAIARFQYPTLFPKGEALSSLRVSSLQERQLRFRIRRANKTWFSQSWAEPLHASEGVGPAEFLRRLPDKARKTLIDLINSVVKRQIGQSS